jgi:hypothetical protein
MTDGCNPVSHPCGTMLHPWRVSWGILVGYVVTLVG